MIIFSSREGGGEEEENVIWGAHIIKRCVGGDIPFRVVLVLQFSFLEN